MRSIAIIAMVAVIGFSFAACDDGNGGGGGGGGGGGTAPTITTTSLPDGIVGIEYSYSTYSGTMFIRLAATGDTPITWSIETGTLPAGLTLSENAISGTPTTAGTSNFTVKATNAKGSNTKALSIVIAPAPAFTLTGIPAEHNGKYAELLADAGGSVKVESSIVTGSSRRTLISNGSVTITLSPYSGSGSYGTYIGNDTYGVSVLLYNVATGGTEILYIYFEDVTFSNGSAARTWSQGEVQ